MTKYMFYTSYVLELHKFLASVYKSWGYGGGGGSETELTTSVLKKDPKHTRDQKNAF